MNALFNEVKCGNPRKLAERMAFFEKEFPVIDDDCRSDECIEKAFCYQMCISSCAQMIYSWHFGFRALFGAGEILKKGVAMAQTYFPFVAKDLEKVAPEKSGNQEIAWFGPYSQALLLATLADCKNERKRLSDYLHANLVVEQVAIPIEPALGDVLLCIAASFQSSPMNTAALEERLQKSRKKRPKLLHNARQALDKNDRPKFIAALAESTENFAKTTAEDDLPLTAIAVQESILVALAYERGWTDLKFESPIAARLVTHQSLEMN